MSEFLSSEWFSEMSQAAASAITRTPSTTESPPLRIKEIVRETPRGDITYVLSLADDGVIFTDDLSAIPYADVSIAQEYATAVALHKGELTLRDAFFAGRVRVSGKINVLLENVDTLKGLASSFEEVRARTTYA